MNGKDGKNEPVVDSDFLSKIKEEGGPEISSCGTMQNSV